MLKVLVIENQPSNNNVGWWMEYLPKCDKIDVDILNVWPSEESVESFIYNRKNELQRLLRCALKIHNTTKKSQYHLIITFQCSRESFLLSFYQSLFKKKRPSHVILDFIMREKNNTVISKLKYLFMRFCFSSIAFAVCSSTGERDYYRTTFNWPENKTIFVPLFVRPTFLKLNISYGDYIFSAGRTFRDYETLLKAVTGLSSKVVIVAGRKAFENISVPIPDNVKILQDISMDEYSKLLSQAMFVVLPLQEKKISVGQQVLLESMVLGKAVIATSVSGVVDYVIDGVTGLLVKPKDYMDLRSKITLLIEQPDLRTSIGYAAQERIKNHHQVQHYINTLVTSQVIGTTSFPDIRDHHFHDLILY